MVSSNAKDPLLCNSAALRKASRRISQLYDLVLAPSGMKCTQHSILVHVERMQSPSMTELAHAMVLDRSALAHNLKPLERDQFVTTVADQFDGRSRRVLLTEAGKVKLAECKALWAGAQKKFESAYGKEKSAALRLALSEIFSDEFLEKYENA